MYTITIWDRNTPHNLFFDGERTHNRKVITYIVDIYCWNKLSAVPLIINEFNIIKSHMYFDKVFA